MQFGLSKAHLHRIEMKHLQRRKGFDDSNQPVCMTSHAKCNARSVCMYHCFVKQAPYVRNSGPWSNDTQFKTSVKTDDNAF